MNFLLSTVLSGNYYLITVTDVFQGALELKRRKNIDLIIADLDFQTPEVLDFIQHINSSSLYKKPIIVLFSYQNNKAKQLEEMGVYAHFLKPFNPVELLRSVDELILQRSLI